MYLFKEEEKIKIVLIDFKNKPKSTYFSVAKWIKFYLWKFNFLVKTQSLGNIRSHLPYFPDEIFLHAHVSHLYLELPKVPLNDANPIS